MDLYSATCPCIKVFLLPGPSLKKRQTTVVDIIKEKKELVKERLMTMNSYNNCKQNAIFHNKGE